MPKKSERITLRHLAKELGLSDRSVSQALSPRESNVKLSPETVARVQKLAQKWNYRPDSRARSMRYGRFYNIGYFEAKKTATAWPLLGAESGVFDAASENRYRVVLIRLPSDMCKDQNSIPSAFREGNLDALVLSHAGNLSPEVEEVIDASGFPVIYLNEKKKKNAVFADDFNGMAQITEHLISVGKRKIVYLNPVSSHDENLSDAHYSVRDRKLGYLETMGKSGLVPTIIEGPGADPNWDGGQLSELLKASGKVDAIACYSDFIALNCFRVLYKYPQHRNLAVTGFGNDFGIYCSPVALTTIRTPFYDMGKAAVEMALTLVNTNQKSVPARKFELEIIIRDSTRA